MDHAFEFSLKLSALEEEHNAENKIMGCERFFSKIPRALLFKYGCLSGKKEREKC